jgi:hypothetical protein
MVRRILVLLFALIFPLAALADDLAVDVRDFGAKPDGLLASAPTNSAAFKAAITAIDARLDHSRPTRGVVRVPGGLKPYLIDRPIVIDRPDIWIVGDGPQSVVQCAGVGPTVLVGVRESEPAKGGGVVQLPATARPSRQGKLDGTWGGYGVRTGGDSTVAFAGTPFDLGPVDPALGGMSAWSVSTLVIDLAIERNADGGAWPGGKVDGILMLGGYNNRPTLAVQKGGGPDTLDVILTDSSGRRGAVSVAVGPDPVKRVSVQIDLKARAVAAWTDRVQVAARVEGDAFGPNGSGVLLANQRDAMILGATTADCDGRPPVGAPGLRLPDWTFWGLSLSGTPKYRADGVGKAQVSLDGRVANDAYLYGYGDGWHPAACLLGSGDTKRSTRLVEAYSGTNSARRFYGVQLQVGQCRVLGGMARNGLRDLNLVGPGATAGPTVQLFSLLDFRAERCRVSGGTQAIGTLHGMATYPVSIDDCDLSATDSPIFGVWSSIDATRCRFSGVGRSAVRVWASNLTLSDARLVFGQPNTDSIVASYAGLYGGRTSIARLEVDFEGEVCRVAPFVVERNLGLTTSFSAEDVYLGSAARGRPIVRTSSMGNGSRPFWLDLKRIDDGGSNPSAQVQDSTAAAP